MLKKQSYFKDLKDIKNKYLSNLKRMEILKSEYATILAKLKEIVDNFTHNSPDYRQKLRKNIKEIENGTNNEKLAPNLDKIEAATNSNDKNLENFKSLPNLDLNVFHLLTNFSVFPLVPPLRFLELFTESYRTVHFFVFK